MLSAIQCTVQEACCYAMLLLSCCLSISLPFTHLACLSACLSPTWLAFHPAGFPCAVELGAPEALFLSGAYSLPSLNLKHPSLNLKHSSGP